MTLRAVARSDSGSDGVQGVTGNIVDNTDPQNPVVTGLDQTSGDVRYVLKAGDTMTGSLSLPLGLASATSINNGTPGVGIYFAAAAVGIASSGLNRISVGTTVTTSVPVHVPDGSAATPSIGGTTAGYGLFFNSDGTLFTNGPAGNNVSILNNRIGMTQNTSFGWGTTAVGSLNASVSSPGSGLILLSAGNGITATGGYTTNFTSSASNVDYGVSNSHTSGMWGTSTNLVWTLAAVNKLQMTTNSFNPLTNAAIQLGAATLRFSNLHTAGIVTNNAFETLTPTNGGTVTIANTTNTADITPAGVIAAATVNLPASPVDGQYVELSFGQTITLLTMGAGANTIRGALTIGTIGTSARYRYRASTTTWLRV